MYELEIARRRVLDPAIRVVSFDFFDTLVARSSVNPISVFPRIAEGLIARGMLPRTSNPHRFLHLRVLAEQRARQAKFAEAGSYEVTLPEIYAAFPERFTLRLRGTLEQLAEAEEAVEIEGLRAFGPVLELYDLAYDAGKTVIVVSDTYFSERLFKTLFAKLRMRRPHRLFLSHERRTGKGGQLWEEVLSEIDVTSDMIFHLGDNYRADVERPASLGIQCLHLAHGTSEFFSLIERELGMSPISDIRFADTWISTTRAKHAVSAVARKSAHSGYGYKVLGPAFAGYTAFAAELFADTAVDAILPLAREGIFLRDLLSLIEPAIHVLEPLSISRRIMRKIELREITEQRLRAALGAPKPPSLAEILDLLNLSPEAGLPPGLDLSNTLADEATIARFLAHVLASPSCIAAIRSQAIVAERGFLAHLDAVLAAAPRRAGHRLRIGLLDIGWNASIQGALQLWADTRGLEIDFVGAYLMTTGAVNAKVFDGVEAHGFLVDGHEPAESAEWLFRTLEILEQSATPVNTGSVAGYAPDGTVREQIPLISRAQRQQIAEIQDGIRAFVRTYFGFAGKQPPSRLERRLIATILERAFLDPTPEELQLFADWSHDENLLALSSDRLLPDDAPWIIDYMSPMQLLRTPMSMFYWPFGVAKRFNPLLNSQVAALRAGALDPESLSARIGEVTIWRMGSGPAREVARQELVVNILGAALIDLSVPGSADAHFIGIRLDKPLVVEVQRMLVRETYGNGRPPKQREVSAAQISRLDLVGEAVSLERGSYLVSGAATVFLQRLPSESLTEAETSQICLGLRIAMVNEGLTRRLEGSFGSRTPIPAEALQNAAGNGWIDSIADFPTFHSEGDVNLDVNVSRPVPVYGWVSARIAEVSARFYLKLSSPAGERLWQASPISRPPYPERLELTAELPASEVPIDQPFKLAWIVAAEGRFSEVPYGYCVTARVAVPDRV
jgi:FMN phosphatase YigB (HAD superfamily)